MKSGLLRHLVKLQSLSTGQDAIGQPVQTWSDVATIWADIRFLNGLETVRADAPVSAARCSIRIRARAVNAGQRIVEGSTVFDIKAVLPDPTGKEYIDLACETGANNG